MAEKRQFNVYLSGSLIRRLRLAALSHETSLSAFVERALTWWLDRLDREGADSHLHIDDHGDHGIGPATEIATKVSLVSRIFVSNMGQSIQFYEDIGATSELRSAHRSIMRLGGAMLALHLATGDKFADRERAGLSMVSLVPIRLFTAQLHRRGIAAEVDSMVDESFGLSILVHDPDGLQIQIYEYDSDSNDRS